MTVAPYVVGWFMVVFQALHSDRTRDRGWHIMGSCAVSFTGYLILATSVQKSVGAAYFALFLVVGGNYSLFPLVMCVFSLSGSNRCISLTLIVTGAGQQTPSRQHPNEVSALRLSSRFPTVSPCESHFQFRYRSSLTWSIYSASPQIYFDPEDEYRKGHAISAG